MTVVWSSQIFVSEELSLAYKKAISHDQKESWHIDAMLCFWSALMLEYQKEIFLEPLTDFVDYLQDDKKSFEHIKTRFEKTLHDINIALAAFGEKMQSKWPFPINGILQLFRWNEYIAGLIGQASVMIVRNDHIHYRVCQSLPDPRPRIDRFNEFLEGELKAEDQIIVTGMSLDMYMDKTDVQTVIDQSHIQELSLDEMLLKLLHTRISSENMWFLSMHTIQSDPLFAEYRFWRTFLKTWSQVTSRFSYLKKFQARAVYIGIGIFGLVLLTWIIDSFLKSVQQSYVLEEGGVVMNLSIEDIQKDIATFKRIEPTSEQKIKKYNEIVAKLDLLESKNKWTVDVKKLKSILEKDYLEWFNIESILDITQTLPLVYTFSQTEKNTLTELAQLFRANGLYVWGKEGVLLWAIDNQVRWSIVSAGVARKVTTCSPNLLKNGLYCAMNDGSLFNITKAWLQPLSTTDGAFIPNIAQVQTFGNSFFYTLNNKSTTTSWSLAVWLTRYTNQRGSQEAFGAATTYDIQTEPTFVASSEGITSLAVDGSFLARSPVSQSLRQLWRPGAEPKLVVRKVPMEGGDKMLAPGKKAKVFAYAETRFVYFWDPETQLFTVYRSTPYKTNDAHTTNYTLQYFFSIKFPEGEHRVIDVAIEEWEKASLYVMSAYEIRKLSLSELRERFFAKEEEKNKAQ